MDDEVNTDLVASVVREVVDREQIKALKHAYCRHADALDPAGMASVFADDCRISFRPGDARVGREQIREFYATALAPTVSSSHHISNMDIRFTGPDRAETHCYLYSWQRFGGHPGVPDRHRWARYEDVFVRTADGWRQSELVYVVAGELSGEENLRVGEVVGRPLWTAPPPFTGLPTPATGGDAR